MLEIIALILLCNVNRKNAMARGRKPGAFIALTLGLWIGLELAGAIIGQAAKLELGAYWVAILFAVIGGIVSYFMSKDCEPGREAVSSAFGSTADEPQAAVTVMHAPDDGRAVTAGIAVAVGWLALFLVQAAFYDALQFNDYAESLTASAILGIGAYLCARRERRLVVIGVIMGALFAVLYACSSFVFFAQAFFADALLAGLPIETVVNVTLMRLAAMLACAALALGSVMVARRVRARKDRGGSLYANAGIAGGVMFAFLVAYYLVRAALGGSPLLESVPTALILGLPNGGTAFFATVFAGRLCAMQTGGIRLRGLGLAWAWVAACASGLLLMALVSIAVTGADSAFYSSAIVLAACGLVGYIMLVCGKREGLYVVVGGTALMLASQFFSALAGFSAAPDFLRSDYIMLMASSVVGAVNPVLAWLSVRYSSQPADTADPAASAARAEAASAFDLVAAICNIAMGAALAASMTAGALQGTGIVPAIFATLLVGVLFAACGVAVVVVRRKRGGKIPSWLRVAGIVMFAIGASALAVAFVQLTVRVLF